MRGVGVLIAVVVRGVGGSRLSKILSIANKWRERKYYRYGEGQCWGAADTTVSSVIRCRVMLRSGQWIQ